MAIKAVDRCRKGACASPWKGGRLTCWSVLSDATLTSEGAPLPLALVIDDSQVMRELLAHLLKDADCEVVEASDGVEGIAKLEESSPDFVVLDVHIGSGNGIEFLRELRRDYSGIKVAMLTGSDRLEGVDSDAVIPKPFTIEQLTSTVAKLAPRSAPTAG